MSEEGYQMSHKQPAMYALLVGIDDYASPRVPDLGGCVNDVDAMEQLLRDKFQVPPENIKKLTNSQATHQAIKDAFKQHLINQAQAWAKAGRNDTPPAFLFHYSGHGSQAPDETGTEPDGMDETIVPHDRWVGDVFDIKDWELGQLLDELTQNFVDKDTQKYVGNVTVILDCCHSGSGARAVQPNLLPTRRCKPDLRPQPTQRPAATTRGVSTASGWLKKDERYVLLAACRDREEANEHIVREGDGRHQHGAMTYFMLESLAQMSASSPLTYRELHEQVSYLVHHHYQTQMPQCEGDREREVFGGLHPTRDVWLTVTDKRQGFIWVDGGVAHGLTEGSQLQVYPPETRTLADVGQPMATLTVKSVSAVQSGCLVVAGREDIPLNAKAMVSRLDPVNMQRRVNIDIPDDTATRHAVQKRLADDDVKNYVEIVAVDVPADFRIVKEKNRLQIQDGAGALLVAPFALDDLPGLGRDLAHLVRYQNALALRNQADNSMLAGKVGLALKKLDFDPNTQKPVAVELERMDGGELVIETGQKFVLEITNRADIPLNFSVLEFGYAWDIVQLYPEVRGAHEELSPGKTLSIGLSADPEKQYAFNLEGENLAEVREVFKVIATRAPTNFDILTQGELKTAFTPRSASTRAAETSPLNQLLDLAMSMDIGVRAAATKQKPSVKDEWTTAQQGILIIEPSDATRALRGGDEPITVPSYEIKLEAPVGFSGGVRILTERQNTRSALGDPTDLIPPPGLAPFGDVFQPLPVKSTRAVGPAGAVIEIDAADEARWRITADTPLKIHLPAELADEETSLLALAYDGSLFYPVGRPGEVANVLNVEWLPAAAPADQPSTRSTRNLGRTVKLYLYKNVLKWEEPSLGLYKARFVSAANLDTDKKQDGELVYQVQNGAVCYREFTADEIKPGDRVALFVHGFTSETRWMVSGPAQFLAQNGQHYDHILTFDYETYSTPVKDNGKLLYNALKKAGFNADDGRHLDVFAHSMGALVCRSMIEQHGGAEFVDRYIMAGPPNKGSRLAEAKRLITWLGILLLNQAGPTLPSLLTSWVLKKVSDDGEGMNDLRPGSDFIKKLNSQNKPANVPYYLLAGYNELDDETERAVWRRLAHTMQQGLDTVLDFIFSDQNDMVISVRSMKSITGDKLEKVEVPCNHFEYFSANNVQAQLLSWLGRG
jgi:pimeloyl-ACP methyl ester carboxylesterase